MNWTSGLYLWSKVKKKSFQKQEKNKQMMQKKEEEGSKNFVFDIAEVLLLKS